MARTIKGDGLRAIYTQKVHHLECVECRDSTSTNDGSHELTKAEAAAYFEQQGWDYSYGKGWLCSRCKISVNN